MDMEAVWLETIFIEVLWWEKYQLNKMKLDYSFVTWSLKQHFNQVWLGSLLHSYRVGGDAKSELRNI